VDTRKERASDCHPTMWAVFGWDAEQDELLAQSVLCRIQAGDCRPIMWAVVGWDAEQDELLAQNVLFRIQDQIRNGVYTCRPLGRS